MVSICEPPPNIAREIRLEDQIQPAVYEFNQHPSKAIQQLCEAFSLPFTPRNAAHLMHIVPGLIGTRIGEFLSNKKNEDILYHYFNEVDMHFPFIEALRAAFSNTLHLPAEGEQIDRILKAISAIFVEQNPDCGLNADQAYILSYATTLLNSDLHNPRVVRKMTVADFISNIRNALPDDSIKDKFLEEVYQNVRARPFTFRRSVEESITLVAPKLKGFLLKKDDTWKSVFTSFYFVLANSGLYYFKDDSPQALEKPLGVIQLISTQVSAEGKYKITIKASKGDLQHVKFKSTGSTLMKGQQKLFLKASSTENRDKWLYRMKTSTVFSRNSDVDSSINSNLSSGAFGTDVSEVQCPGSDSSLF